MSNTMSRLRFILLFTGFLLALGVAVAIWYFAPNMRFGEYAPFSSMITRAILAVAVVLFLLIILFLIELLSRPKDVFDGAILKKQELDTSDHIKDFRSIDASLRKVVDNIKSIFGKSFIAGGGRYRLPWYVVIGPKGAGKSALLDNAGLRMMQVDSGKWALNFDGFSARITEEAVFVETRGPFERGEGSSLFRSLGRALRRIRFRNPLNGLIVVMPFVEFLKPSDQIRLALYQDLRESLSAFHSSVGVDIPIYLVLTKIDEVKGFETFFNLIDEDRRRQVFGFSFPMADERIIKEPVEIVDQTDQQYCRFIAWQGPQVLQRTNQISDSVTDFQTFLFLPRLAAARRALVEFVEDIFKPSKAQAPLLLRGVYLVSAIPDQSAFIDTDTSLEAQARTAHLGRGDGFFVDGLFNKLILREAGLVEASPRNVRRDRIQLFGLSAIVLAVIGILLFAWVTTYIKTHFVIAAVSEDVEQITPVLERFKEVSLSGSPRADLIDVLRPLNLIRTMALVDSKASFGFNFTAGLDNESRLQRATKIQYDKSLQRSLLPIVKVLLTRELAREDGEDAALSDTLRVYLMLGGDLQLEETFVLNWLNAYVRRNLPATLESERRHLMEHFRSLIAIPNIKLVVDRDLVAAVRERLQRTSLLDQALEKMRNRPDIRNLPPWRINEVAGPLSFYALSRKSGRPLSEPFLGLYRGDSFQAVVLPALVESANLVIDQAIALALVPRTTSELELRKEVYRQTLEAFLNDRVTVWNSILNDVSVLNFSNFATQTSVLQAFTGLSSPYSEFLRNVAKQGIVSLGGASSVALAGDQATKGVATEAVSELAGSRPPLNTALPVAVLQELLGATADTAIKKANDQFSPLQRFVDGQQSPLDETIRLLQSFSSIVAAGGTDNATTPNPNYTMAIERLKTAALAAPPYVAESINYIVRQSSLLNNVSAATELDLVWRRQIFPFCTSATDGKFPFSAADSEVPLADFSRLFAPNGQLDNFFNRYLKAQVDTSTTPWRMIPTSAVAVPITPAALKFFEQVNAIRQSYYPDGSPLLGAAFDISITELDPGALRVVLEIDGQVASYQYGPVQSVSMKWPGTTGSARVDFGAPSSGIEQPIAYKGPWSLFRFWWSRPVRRPTGTQFTVPVTIGQRSFTYVLNASSVNNPFRQNLLQGLKCPPSLLP